MASINKAILIGNLGRDPEIRYTPDGMQVATFSIATTDRIKDEDRTEWHRIVAFGRLAEICGQYLAKGKQVYIEGRLQTREWQDRDGNKRSTTEIIANIMKMLGPAPSGASAQRGYQEGDRTRPEPRPSSGRGRGEEAPDKEPDYGGPEDHGPPGDDDIPF